jgi:hypothetical protein
MSRFTARIAGALALSGMLIQPVLAGPPVTGSHLPFAATATRCRTEETHGWATPAGYLRGQSVMCDLVSNEVLVKGQLTLQHACPTNGAGACTATFIIATATGARWEGVYWTEEDGGQMVLRGAGQGGSARMQIVFTLRNLASVSGWGDSGDDNVTGRIVALD